MTEIETRLANDLVTATRARSSELTVLRLLRAALHNESIAKKATGELTEQDVMTVCRRELKRRQEAAEMYLQGGRPELAQAEQAEAKVIEKYLPPVPPLDEVKQAMVQLKSELGLAGQSAVGQLTKAALEHFKGSVDGKTASGLAREILNQ
jgi:uncharacterized protein